MQQPYARITRALAALGAGAVTLTQAQTLPPPAASPAPVVNYEYDAQGNPTRTTQAPGVAGFGFATSSSYDRLQRPTETTDARSGRTRLEYDGLDRITRVTDPRSLVTQYPRNGLGDATQLISPDTGSAGHTFDAAGNLRTRTDSRGVLATYGYDTLNRLTSVVYSQSGQSNVTYGWSYDQTGAGFSNGIGRLTTATFPGGSTRYAYDSQGRLTSASQTVGVVLNTGYGYDAAGRVNRITYPSGRVLSISYTNGLPSAMALARDGASTAEPLLSQIRMQPFGAPEGWLWHLSSGTVAHERVFDTSGRLVRYRLGSNVRDLRYDAADRISGYTHLDASSGAAVPALDQSFAYDQLGRLTAITTASASWSIGYDANGNRTGVTLNGSTSANTISATSNRLTGMTNPARSFMHDNAGNTTSDSAAYTATYGLDNRLATLTRSGTTASYTYDNAGQRVRKTVGGVSTLFVYDQGGQLLGEYDSAGQAIREYVWLQDIPVAVFTPNGTNPPNVFYVHTDHINTPRVVVDRNNALRWRWMAEPFGATAAETNPAGLGAFTFNLRFPGQYFDSESGLHYNWNRYYDPATGRYITSDPIGLAGGINTYAYVDANPLLGIDPTGLVRHTTGRWIDCGKGCRIRIDYTLDERTGVIRRHLHWECKGREGVCGENGDESHGGTWGDVPEHIKECARRHGFNGAAAPAAPAPAAGAPTPSRPSRYSGESGDRTTGNPFVPPHVYDPVQDRWVPGTTGPSRPAYGPMPVPGGGPVILPP